MRTHGTQQSYYIHAAVYYSESVQITTSKGKRYMGQGPGETRSELPVVFSSGVVSTALRSPSDDV